MENTTNLNLPLLVSNQSQKEVTHNEAITIIDNILQNGIIDKDLTTPPTSPNSNDLYIVGSSATDDWADEDGNLAFYDNGWRFIEPREGATFWVNDEDCLYTYNGSEWEQTLETISNTVEDLDDLSDVSITSASQYDLLQHDGTNFVNTKEIQNLSLVGVNATADSTNKLSVKSDAILFDNATDDSQVKVNKASLTDTASHLFQTNYSGRAEFGLVGDDDFTLKVSSDGSTWNESFVVDNTNGDIDFKGTITNNGSSIGGSDLGSWVDSYSSLSTATSVSTHQIDLSSYLPSDSNNYEIILSWRGYTANANVASKVSISSDIITTGMLIAWCYLGTGTTANTIVVPVGSGRYINYIIATNALNVDTILYVSGYRKIK
ncbi:MAG TPA: DUF2793 domain-containing protein [Rickettsiales bacterium]|nr:DUF2793 domain-containing protein [Rickettsiales bacterium]